MTDPVAETPGITPPWANLPVALFGSVMGLTGLSIVWRQMHAYVGTPAWIATSLAIVALIDFMLLLVAYGAKALLAPGAVLAEFRHPIAGSLFGTFFVSLMLLPILLAPYSLGLARILWLAGTAGMLVFAWVIVSRWLSTRQHVAHASPAWFVPVVGLLGIPLAVPALAVSPVWAEAMRLLMTMSLAVGLFFAVVLFTLVFSRLLFEDPMPEGLQPTLLILAAPCAVGSASYTIATGSNGLFAQSLYTLMLFLLAALLPRIRHLPRCCPFRFSWWAVSFPLAASASTALQVATSQPSWLAEAIAWLLLVFATTIILGLLVRTLSGLFKGELSMLNG